MSESARERPISDPGSGTGVFVEAESFDDYGGWVMDQQAMDVMGSAYLLAHGLGRPVANARTRVHFGEGGKYRLWVRTRDWVAPEGPGRFRVRLNGNTVGGEFGAGGDGAWRWWEGGVVETPAGEAIVELEDLTGFDGRCDALFFAKEVAGAPAGPPPGSDPELAQFRKRALGLPEGPEDGGRFDFVVAGGGYAGVCAAIAAARRGLKVALVQDRPVLLSITHNCWELGLF